MLNDSSNQRPAAVNRTAASTGYLDKEQLRELLNLPSTRMVDELMRKRKIPFLKLGHKTIRFEWSKVKAAIEKFEHKAVGQK